MLINTENIFSMTDANRNFTNIAHTVDKNGEAIIFKNNKPMYVVLNAEKVGLGFELTDDEKIDIVAKRVLDRYIDAFKELAK